MATINESSKWELVYQIETTDPVMGGADGIANAQAKQLANRTLFLKGEVEKLKQADFVTAEEALNAFADKSHTHELPTVEQLGAVNKGGDTMQGPLILSAMPNGPMVAAPMAYVDQKFAQSQSVRQPSNITPANAAAGIASTTTLQAGTYYSLYGIAQSSAQFQVSTTADFATMARDITLAAVNSWAITPALTANTSYFWRVRFRDAENAWSAWSTPTQFATGSITIATPSITSPTANQTGIGLAPQLTSTAFAVSGGSDTHASSRWQIASDAMFSTILFDSGISTTNKTSYTIPSNLAFGGTYYARVQYTGTSYGSSPWSATIAFTTLTGTVVTPTINAPTSGSVNISLTPSLTSSAFGTTGAGDTHSATDWEIRTADNGGGTLVWSSANNVTNKVNIQVSPALASLTTYYARARHKGANFGYGAWSASVSFTTQVAPGEQVYTSPGTYTCTVQPGVSSISLAVVSGEGTVPTSIGTYSAVGGLNPLIQDLPALPAEVNQTNTRWGADVGDVVSSGDTVLALIASRSYLRKTSYSGEWTKLQLPDAYSGAAIDPNSNIASAFGNNRFFVCIASKMFVSSDKGLTWNWYSCPDFISLATSKLNNVTYLVGITQNGAVYTSTNNGASFNNNANIDAVWSGGWANLVGFDLATNYAGVLFATRGGNNTEIAYSIDAGFSFAKVTVPQGLWKEIAQCGNGVIINQQVGSTGLYFNATFNASTQLVSGFEAAIQSAMPIGRMPQGGNIVYGGTYQTVGLDGSDYDQISILNNVSKNTSTSLSINSAKANSKFAAGLGLLSNQSRLVNASWGVVILNLSSSQQKSITVAPVTPQVTNLNAYLSGISSTAIGEAGSATKDGIGIIPNLSTSGAYGGGSAGYKNGISVTPGQQFSVVIPIGGAVRVIWGVGRSFPNNAA